MNNCTELSSESLQWCNKFRYFDDKLLPDIFNDQNGYFKTLCDKLQGLFSSYVVYSEKVKALAGLITQNDIDKAPDSLYLQIFRWCSFNIGIASHEGRASHENDDTAEGTWRLKIVPFEKKVVERYPKYFSYFVNCFYFVNNRHDAYDFRPEIPAEFDKIRELLESGYKKIKGVST